MSRVGITFEDVVLAADKLQQEGTHPTIEKIRLILGAGSNTTISKYLKDWRDSRLTVKPSVTSPPDQVQAAVSAVWERLHQETQANIEAVKAEAQNQVEVARQDAEAANTALSMLKAEYEALKTQHHALAAQKELLALDYKHNEANQQLLCERLDALEARHQEIKSIHEQQLKRLEEKYVAEIEHLKSHTEQEVQLARQLADTLKSHYEDARVDSIRQLDQLKVENQKNYDVIKRLEVENAGLKQLLEAKTEMYQQVTAQLTEAQKLIQTQQTQWDVLQDKRFVTEDIVTAFQALPAHVANELHTRLTEQVKEVMDQAAKAMYSKLKEVEHA